MNVDAPPRPRPTRSGTSTSWTMHPLARHTARTATAAAALAAAALLFPAPSALAQLRPLEPALWHVFDPAQPLAARVGIGLFADQRASLAGTEGALRELGTFQAAWRSGRFALEVGGTALRAFEDRRSFTDPLPTVTAAGPDRRDAGDLQVATLVRLTPADRPAAAVLRFGTRLPTTDDHVGIERDRTDFFALLGGFYRRSGVHLSAEAGVSINGTLDPTFEQADLLAYALHAEVQHGWITPLASLVGQVDGFKGWAMRGNEQLAELRAGVRVGRRHWVQATLVRGLEDFSPRTGLLLGAGLHR